MTKTDYLTPFYTVFRLFEPHKFGSGWARAISFRLESEPSYFRAYPNELTVEPGKIRAKLLIRPGSAWAEPAHGSTHPYLLMIAAVSTIISAHFVQVYFVANAIRHVCMKAAISTIKVTVFDVVFRVAMAISNSSWIWATIFAIKFTICIEVNQVTWAIINQGKVLAWWRWFSEMNNLD